MQQTTIRRLSRNVYQVHLLPVGVRRLPVKGRAVVGDSLSHLYIPNCSYLRFLVHQVFFRAPNVT